MNFNETSLGHVMKLAFGNKHKIHFIVSHVFLLSLYSIENKVSCIIEIVKYMAV